MSHSTPISFMSYWDNPLDNLEYLISLTKEEVHIYSLGYVQACYHIMENLSETKRRILTNALEVEPSPAQKRLLGLVKLLDVLDEAISDRVAQIFEESR